MVVEAACCAAVSHKDGVPVRPSVVEPHREAPALQVTSYRSPPTGHPQAGLAGPVPQLKHGRVRGQQL